MKIILSDKLEDKYVEFKVVRTFKEAEAILINGGDFDVFIIHEFQGRFFEATMYLTKLNKARPGLTYMYIAARPIREVADMMVGLKATILNETFYFETESELIALVEEVQSITETALVDTSSIDILKTYLDYVDKGSPKMNVPIVKNKAKRAMEELSVMVVQQKQELQEMGNTALALCKQSSEMIAQLAENNRVVADRVKMLQELSASTKESSSGIGQGITNFPTHRYAGSTKVVVFKEYTPCRYLTSFILGYANYVRYQRNKKVKVVITHQKGRCLSEKYGIFTTISPESENMMSLYDGDIVATNVPKASVLKKLLESKVDVIIVIDRMYNDYDIVSGKTVRYNAINGYSDIARYKLKENETIFTSINIPNAFYCIPTIKNYPANIDSRKAMYAQQCKECYERINSDLKLV